MAINVKNYSKWIIHNNQLNVTLKEFKNGSLIMYINKMRFVSNFGCLFYI